MSLPITAAGPLNVATNPILALSCAALGVAASASRAATTVLFFMSSSLDVRFFVGWHPLLLAPELPAGEIGALAHRLELLPHHGVVYFGAIERLGREAAIRGGDHVLAAHQLGKAHDAFRDQLRMLHDVAGMGDHAGADHLALRELDPLEQVVFVLVTRIGAFEAVGTGVDLEHVADHVGEAGFVEARAPVDAAAG